MQLDVQGESSAYVRLRRLRIWGFPPDAEPGLLLLISPSDWDLERKLFGGRGGLLGGEGFSPFLPEILNFKERIQKAFE